MRRFCTRGRKGFGNFDEALALDARAFAMLMLTSPSKSERRMTRPVLVLTMLVWCGVCVSAETSWAAEPGLADSAHRPEVSAGTRAHRPIGKSVRQNHKRRAARHDQHKRPAVTDSALPLVHRQNDAKEPPLSDAPAAPKAGAASEITITPHMWLNFGGSGRL
jgi:hypothetical protein